MLELQDFLNKSNITCDTAQVESKSQNRLAMLGLQSLVVLNNSEKLTVVKLENLKKEVVGMKEYKF